jgi:hypothetical protein
MGDQLDEQQLAQIRVWAEAMLTHDQAELRAAARGLLLLADEIDRLREASRHAFAEDIGTALATRLGTEPTAASPEAAPLAPPIETTTTSRLSGRFHR